MGISPYSAVTEVAELRTNQTAHFAAARATLEWMQTPELLEIPRRLNGARLMLDGKCR